MNPNTTLPAVLDPSFLREFAAKELAKSKTMVATMLANTDAGPVKYIPSRPKYTPFYAACRSIAGFFHATHVAILSVERDPETGDHDLVRMMESTSSVVEDRSRILINAKGKFTGFGPTIISPTGSRKKILPPINRVDDEDRDGMESTMFDLMMEYRVDRDLVSLSSNYPVFGNLSKFDRRRF